MVAICNATRCVRPTKGGRTGLSVLSDKKRSYFAGARLFNGLRKSQLSYFSRGRPRPYCSQPLRELRQAVCASVVRRFCVCKRGLSRAIDEKTAAAAQHSASECAMPETRDERLGNNLYRLSLHRLRGADLMATFFARFFLVQSFLLALALCCARIS